MADLGAHLASLPKLYREQHVQGVGYEQPDDWAKFSIAVRSHIDAVDGLELAAMVEAEAEALVADAEGQPNSPRFLYGQQTTAGLLVSGMLSELLMHGRDLGALTGTKVAFTRRHGNAIVGQTMALAPAFLDPAKAQTCDGTYQIRFRGGDTYTWLVTNGVLTVKVGRATKADARLLAEPHSFLLVSLGRMSQVKAGLMGHMIAYGPKPWKFIALGNSSVEGF